MRLSRLFFGSGVEKIPDTAFRVMSFFLRIRDIVAPVETKLSHFDITEGSVIIDYGCGPGSYLEELSRLAGNTGKVYAVDVHPLAIQSVEKKIKNKGLDNVVPILSTGYPVDIAPHSADMVFAMDMFHHVKDHKAFFQQLIRILKPDGRLYIEKGHQPKTVARKKLCESWIITDEREDIFYCKPRPADK